ncbi:hypothetical protein ACVGWV_03340, partial [Enterobacter asburiae]
PPDFFNLRPTTKYRITGGCADADFFIRSRAKILVWGIDAFFFCFRFFGGWRGAYPAKNL